MKPFAPVAYGAPQGELMVLQQSDAETLRRARAIGEAVVRASGDHMLIEMVAAAEKSESPAGKEGDEFDKLVDGRCSGGSSCRKGSCKTGMSKPGTTTWSSSVLPGILASSVTMKLKKSDADCVQLSTFDKPATFTAYEFNDDEVTITVSNAMSDEDGMVPGVGYDFEILYSALDCDTATDRVLPIPYAYAATAMGETFMPQEETDAAGGHNQWSLEDVRKFLLNILSATKGVNCGPAILP